MVLCAGGGGGVFANIIGNIFLTNTYCRLEMVPTTTLTGVAAFHNCVISHDLGIF